MEETISLARQVIRQLHRSGHYLHYKMGDKAGRRRVLMILSEEPALLQRELQDRLGIQSGSLSEILIKMEADGLIERGKSPRDARNVELRVTDRGRAEEQTLRAEFQRQTERMMACFTEVQLKELRGLLDIMLNHWEAMEPDHSLFPPAGDEKNETRGRRPRRES